MAKLSTTNFLLCYLAIALIPGTYSSSNHIIMPSSYSDSDQEPNRRPAEEWFRNLNREKEKLTKLHFYVQDVISGDNQTLWQVAESEITDSSPSSFGLVYMADDWITAAPEPDSEALGRAQGLVGFADLRETALLMAVNFVFTEGKYNGSTISILGRNMVSEAERELSIVGGTGAFRMARGIAVTSTRISFDETGNYQVLEYTLYFSHY